MDVVSTANRLLTEHGLAQEGWKFEFDNAKRRAGQCRYRDKTITLSRHYVQLNYITRPDDVLDTILHEIAHALVGGGHGHDEVWKAECVRIGARPERCYDSGAVDMPKGNMVATCGGCAKVFRKHRVPRGKDGKIYVRWCSTCGPDKGKLEFKSITAKPEVPAVLQTGSRPPTIKLKGT